MNTVWQSKELHEHQAAHRSGTMGYVCLSGAGVYALKVGSSVMSCPQDWASAIHARELANANKIKEALVCLDEAIRGMNQSKAAFQSKLVAEGRKKVEEGVRILKELI